MCHVAPMPLEVQSKLVRFLAPQPALVSLDPHDEYINGAEDALLDLLALVDLFLPSRREAALLYGRDAPEDAAGAFLSRGPRAVAIKLGDRGPIFYRQERMGLDGKPFEIVKFRSMRVGAEKDTGAKWAEKDDPRRTRVGRFIRETSLDELPQLFNVLLGDMSVVGPRPERPQFVEQFRAEFPHYMLRHKVRAGMTGWAQVHGWRGNTSIRIRIEHDLYYIENWSLLLDLKILFMTVIHGLKHENAY